MENVDVVVADHVQRVMKANFAASWEEIGEENQVEETFALNSMKDIPGEPGRERGGRGERREERVREH